MLNARNVLFFFLNTSLYMNNIYYMLYFGALLSVPVYIIYVFMMFIEKQKKIDCFDVFILMI